MNNKVKYGYEFVTGKPVEIEIDEKWAAILEDMDREEQRNNRNETRRHSQIKFDGNWFADEELDPAIIIDKQEHVEELLEMLGEEHRDMFCKVIIDGYKTIEYANLCGVDKSAISHRMNIIRNKFKKVSN